MSTINILAKLEQQGRLVNFLPNLASDESDIRELYILPSLNAWLKKDMEKPRMQENQAAVNAHLTEFIKGALIDNQDFMKCLDPNNEGVWALRVRYTTRGIQYRVFGAFINKDCFFATHLKERKEFLSYKHWEPEIKKVKYEWNKLFNGHLIIQKKSFKELVDNGEERAYKNKKKRP
jgi:hypothetical protein